MELFSGFISFWSVSKDIQLHTDGNIIRIKIPKKTCDIHQNGSDVPAAGARWVAERAPCAPPVPGRRSTGHSLDRQSTWSGFPPRESRSCHRSRSGARGAAPGELRTEGRREEGILDGAPSSLEALVTHERSQWPEKTTCVRVSVLHHSDLFNTMFSWYCHRTDWLYY